MAVVQQFTEQLARAIHTERFVKLSLGNYKGSEPELKNIYIKPVLIKRELKLSFVYRYARRDVTKNYGIDEGIALVRQQLQVDEFRIGTLFTTDENLTCEWRKNGQWVIRVQKTSGPQSVSLSHDKVKARKIDATRPYLHELRLTDAQGRVYKSAQDKWRQINHYIELLHTELDALPSRDVWRVVDMGSGKGYLTFALYDYISKVMKHPVLMQGVEYRSDLVDLCNRVAARAGMTGLSFVQGGIEDYETTERLDMLIALHACDTATDEAIYKGIQHGAQLIVTAPCCHKQIRRQLEQTKVDNELSFMTRHGIFLERHAEMLTDSLRSLLLEYSGYKTKVLQFVSDAHTPKNVMILATKVDISDRRRHEIADKLRAIKSYFGITYHHLERLLGLEL